VRIAPFAAAALGALSAPAFALNILISNDDGMSSNVKALYEALKAAGHDVIVSVPCTGQSGRGAGIIMYSTTTIVPTNDSDQVNAAGGCRNGAAPIGAPAVGPFTRAGFDNGDYYYVHGTPVSATLYGLDVVAAARWGKAPDLLLSGPNEGGNIGKIVVSSGTVGNVQTAAARGVPSIAVSAGTDTTDNTNLASPYSAVVATMTVRLVDALREKAGSGPLLPPGLSLNVNFPNAPTTSLPFKFSRFGTYEAYTLTFRNTPPYGVVLGLNAQPPTAEQSQDESVLYKTAISVTAMQVGFESRTTSQEWMRLRLRDLLTQ